MGGPGRRTHTVVESPVGWLTLVAEDGVLARLHMDDDPPPLSAALGERADADFTEALRQLDGYFAGELTRFDLPLALGGTPFQQRVWQALQDIPYGRTASYGEIADRIGQPTAARAVGLANGRNPIGIVVPCHRVIGSTGKLVGYGAGVDRKRRLLELERRGHQPTLL